MIKGIHKQMIVIKTDKNSSFEAAYFLLRSDISKKAEDRDILREANRIVRSSLPDKEKENKEKKQKRHNCAIFCLGALAGAISMGFIWLISMVI